MKKRKENNEKFKEYYGKNLKNNKNKKKKRNKS
jgi:hypothetical protein